MSQCNQDCNACFLGQKNRVFVLVSGNIDSAESFDNVRVATRELGVRDDVQPLTLEQAANFKDVAAPALIVEDKVLSSGKLIEISQAKALIKKALEL